MEALSVWRPLDLWAGGCALLYATQNGDVAVACGYSYRRRHFNADSRLIPTRRNIAAIHHYTAADLTAASAMVRCLSRAAIPRSISSFVTIKGGAMTKCETHA